MTANFRRYFVPHQEGLNSDYFVNFYTGPYLGVLRSYSGDEYVFEDGTELDTSDLHYATRAGGLLGSQTRIGQHFLVDMHLGMGLGQRFHINEDRPSQTTADLKLSIMLGWQF